MRLQLLEFSSAKASKKPPLLFVHGAFCAAWVWQEFFFSWFAERGYNGCAVSLRGHGESAGREAVSTWSLFDYVADVEQVLATMPVAPILIGHSMGAVVVQKLLEKRDFPAAVLLAPSPPDGLLAPMMQMGGVNPNMMSALWGGMNGVPSMNAMADMLFPAQSDELKSRYTNQMEAMESLRVGMDMSMGDTVIPRVGMQTPVTVIGAEHDSLVSTSQLQRAARRYGVEAQIVRSIHHMMMLDGAWENAAEATLKGVQKA